MQHCKLATSCDGDIFNAGSQVDLTLQTQAVKPQAVG